MIATVLAVLAFQQGSITISVDDKKGTKVKMTAREADSTRHRDTTAAKKTSTIVASAEQLANAFADASARSLLARARVARNGQDSSITSYDANTLQRLTIGMAFTRIGRERVFFRTEGSAHTRWVRGIGAQIDVTGKRSVVPLFGGTSEVDIEAFLSPVPYFPGRDAFTIGIGTVKETATDDDVIDPLAKFAEAYYTYRTGDSISFRLPDGATIQLRELEVRPRKADWRAVVGSLWFDASSGQLVRAAYRMSQPLDLWTDTGNDGDSTDNPGFMARAILRPATGTIKGVAIEYGLYQGRFWLPRTQVWEGTMQIGFVRMPVRIDERFTYASVNASDTMSAMRERRTLPVAPPSTEKDSVKARKARRDYVDSVLAVQAKAECDATGQHSMRVDRYDGALPVIVHVPCDTAKLAHSPALPVSIYDKGDEFFGDAERDALLAKAESMMPNLPFAFPRPQVQFGIDLLRYNRVEGLSGAVDVTQMVAPGTTIRFSPRMGTADRVFNADLALERSNGQGTRSFGVYRRLGVVNDWGHPLSLGSGLSAFLFGRDEGFYYRATGAELAGDNLFGHGLDWRVFDERQSDAVAHTNVSVPHVFGSSGFGPRGNIAAAHVHETGASLRKVASFGLDPNAFRALSDVRIEGAAGDSTYARGALDLTVSHGIGYIGHRFFSAAVTGSAGTSVGGLPEQRNWYLGGTNSVRGQSAGALSGNSYWLTRTEVGYGSPGFRRMLFADIGWAGDRTKWSEMGKSASGVGLGWSFLDGLVRADIARGIAPMKQWHTALYMDARF